MLEKECKYRKGVYKVQTFRTTQQFARRELLLHISFHDSDLLFRQPVQPVDCRVDEVICQPDSLPQRTQFAHRALELGLQRLSRLPAGWIYDQLLLIFLQHCQEALIIVLVEALQLCLGREVLYLGPR